MDVNLLEDLLVEEMDPKHMCPICNSLMTSALQCKNGHVCCKNDWERVVNGSKNCFQCRINISNLDQLSKNIYVENEIRNLSIHCPNSKKNPNRKEERNCGDIIKIDTVETHLKNCLYQICECKNSKECGLFERGQLEDHYKVCEYQIIICECFNKMTKRSKQQHQNNDCPVYLVQCQDCSISLQRCQLDNHNNECPEKLIDCQYSNYSCETKIKRNQMQQHLNQVDHLLLVKNKADSLEGKLNQLTVQNNVLRQQLLDLNSKKKYSSKWIIRNWSDKLKKYPIGQSFNSPVFNISSSKKFYLKIYPNGEKDVNRLSISLCKAFDTKCKIGFAFEIQNDDYSKSLIQEETFLFAKGTSDYYTIVFYEDLAADEGYIVNNTLILGFNIQIEKIYAEHLISN